MVSIGAAARGSYVEAASAAAAVSQWRAMGERDASGTEKTPRDRLTTPGLMDSMGRAGSALESGSRSGVPLLLSPHPTSTPEW